MTHHIPLLLLFGFAELSSVLIALSTVGSGSYAIFLALKKVRSNAITAARLTEERIQNRIDEAVKAERNKFEHQHESEQDRIQRLKDIADEWKEIAQMRSLKNEELVKKMTELQKEMKHLEAKYNEVLAVNTDLMKRITELEKRINQ